MEAKKLMIGDWVQCTYWHNPHILQVYELKRVCDDDLKIVVVEDALPLVFQEMYIEPIPLTKEILKKNGFRQVMFDFVLDMMHIRRDENVECFYIVVGGKGTRIAYVHELQHALKLCGIDKEIVL